MNKIGILLLFVFMAAKTKCQVADTLKGLKNGSFEIKHENGSPYLKGNFKNGLRDGKWEIHGHETIFCEYKNGVLYGEYKVVDNGKLLHKWNYKDGKRHGEQTDYYSGEDSKPYEIYYMANDRLNGSFKRLELNGEIKEEAVFANGFREGKTTLYYSGKKKKDLTYKNGLPSGSCVFYDSNGLPEEQGQMIEGKRDGVWKIYEDGKISNTVSYKNGVLISNKPEGEK